MRKLKRAWVIFFRLDKWHAHWWLTSMSRYDLQNDRWQRRPFTEKEAEADLEMQIW